MSQMARVATKRSLDRATSTRAMSRSSPSTITVRVLLRTDASSSGTLPDATSPAAIPAVVPSTITGKTLLVPVEMATMGMSQEPLATARLVPSPPRVITQPTSCSAIAAAARTVSPSLYRADMRSSSTSTERCGSSAALCTRWELSGMASTWSTPTDCRPSNARRTMFTFSQSGTTRPWATRRRISLLAAGFAIIPTRLKVSLPHRRMKRSPLPDDARAYCQLTRLLFQSSLLRARAIAFAPQGQ